MNVVTSGAAGVGGLGKQGFANVIKGGMFCRSIIWPVFPPLMLYQYLRQKDEDMYAVELLRFRSKTDDPKAWYDINMPRGTGHWELQNDLKVIYEKANPGA